MLPPPPLQDRLGLLDHAHGPPGQPGLLAEILRGAGLGRGAPRIRCPRCGWRPRRDSRWVCTPPGCGFEWNTFETRGVCPGCHRQWKVTQCLRCEQVSPHEDWYEREGGEPRPRP